MINAENDGVFESFVGTDSSLAIPQLAVDLFASDPHKCEHLYVETYGFEKRMYWCEPRQYKTESGRSGEMEGFFCAAVLHLLFARRAFVFRPPQLDSDSVELVGEIISYDMFGDEYSDSVEAEDIPHADFFRNEEEDFTKPVEKIVDADFFVNES